MNKYTHKPVMLDEVVDCLNINPEGCYIDATFGRGGHSQAILNKLSDEGQLIVLDKDHEAIEHAKNQFAGDPRIKIIHSCFSEIKKVLSEYQGKIDGILVDLGVSSPQLDNPNRGFSFNKEADLDMRMDHRQEETAASWIAKTSKKELSYVLKRYGDEIDAHRIADKIIAKRELAPIQTTTELTDAIKEAKIRNPKKIHPATKSFQAIRIHVNQELSALEHFLKDAPTLIKHSGVIAVLSFHSLEDRMVKRCFRHLVSPQVPNKLPILDNMIERLYKWQTKRLKPTSTECELNPRARSAVLRAIIKS